MKNITAYEAQVLIGTSILGCTMSPDRGFDLPAAWAKLHKLGLIDRTDGLAIVTPNGKTMIDTMLTRSDPAVRDRVTDTERLLGEVVSEIQQRLVNAIYGYGKERTESVSELVDALIALRTSPPEPASGLPNEVLERACVVGWYGVVSWDEAVRIAEEDPKSSCAIAVPMHRENVRTIIAAALQAIADLPTGKSEEVMEGQEQAYRAVEGLL